MWQATRWSKKFLGYVETFQHNTGMWRTDRQTDILWSCDSIASHGKTFIRWQCRPTKHGQLPGRFLSLWLAAACMQDASMCAARSAFCGINFFSDVSSFVALPLSYWSSMRSRVSMDFLISAVLTHHRQNCIMALQTRRHFITTKTHHITLKHSNNECNYSVTYRICKANNYKTNTTYARGAREKHLETRNPHAITSINPCDSKELITRS